MGIYSDTSTILGLRILTCAPHSYYDLHIEHEFIGTNWKQKALRIIPNYLGKPNIKFQTLHPFSSSYNIETEIVTKPSNIWLNNDNFKLESLL